MLAILPSGREIGCTCVSDGFHGTSLFPPDLATKSGIPPKGRDRRLYEHVLGNDDSAFRGTTFYPIVSAIGQGAAYWAGDGGWVYELESVPSWNVEKELEGQVPKPGGFGDCPTLAELESAVPAMVPVDRVRQAFTVHNGRVVHGNQTLLVKRWTSNAHR